VGWPRDMTAAALVCGSCGTELPPNSKFCNECGAAVATATTPAERAQRGDRDEAMPLMRTAADHLFREGRLLGWGIPVTGVLVETLLDHGAEGDLIEAKAAIERLAAAPADEGLVIRDIWLLRLRALLARAHRDDTAYAQLRDHYRDMARTLGYEGHIAWAEAMP
jgi:zinc-ribbon domain